MLSSKRCQHTGVINVFETSEPHIAVGSVMVDDKSGTYRWHCHFGPAIASGRARDIAAAMDRVKMCLVDSRSAQRHAA